MKIISYSLWGNQPLYIDGAVRNARQRADFFKDYVRRFYIDNTVSDETRKALESEGAEIHLMPQAEDVLGMYWRFNPMYEDISKTERFLVRDTDCAFTKREEDCVREWENSDFPFHIVRDNRVHNIPILGGTWGAIPGCVPDFKFAMLSWLSRVQPQVSQHIGRRYHGTDQQFLCWYVWPRICGTHMAHVRAGEPGLVFSGTEIELPALEENGHFVGMPC